MEWDPKVQDISREDSHLWEVSQEDFKEEWEVLEVLTSQEVQWVALSEVVQ